MDVIDNIKTLIAKAAQAPDSADAMRFAQAASNAANACHAFPNYLRGEVKTDAPEQQQH